MAQAASLDQNLPDLGGPFLYRDQDQDREKASYSLETPYGFLLDLDFLKYVDDIERGQTLRKLPLQRKTKGSKPGLSSSHGRTGGWTSTESISSMTSEDGKPAFSPQTKLWASSSEIREPMSKQASLPLSPILQLLPPPSPKSRVEKTLLETSKRLEEEQRSITGGGTPATFETPSSPSKVNLTWAYASGESHTDPSFPVKMSPSNSGRSTPAAAVSPAHLHHVREQMAAALKQLKELEEQVKVIPILERQICKLKTEKEELVSGIWEKKQESQVGEAEIFRFPPKSPKAVTIVMDGGGGGCQDIHEEHGEAESTDRPSKPRASKIAGLKKLTEKLSASERAGKMGRGSTHPLKADESSHKSVAVGEEVDMNEAVFYYRSQRSWREVAVGRELETRDAEVWVMESLLGVSSEADEELQLLQQTVRHQREVIAMLEGHLKDATDELEELRIEVCARMPRNLLDKETLAQPETAEASVEAVPATRCQAVGKQTEMVDKGVRCSPHVASVGVDCDLQQGRLTPLSCSDKAAQTEVEREHGASGGHTSGQEPGLGTDAPEDGKLRKPSQSLEQESAKETLWREASGLDQELRLVSEPLEKDEETVTVAQRKAEKSGVGGLKSIMKKQDSPSKMEAGTGRKTLQFVGVLNGEYESTSSEEEEEEDENVEARKRSPLSSETDTDGSTDSSDGDFATRSGGSSSNFDPGSSLLGMALDEGKLGHDPEESAEDGNSPAGIASPTMKEKFELSPRMREASLLLKSYLSRGGATRKSKEMLSATSLVLQEWFRLSSQKASLAEEVADHLLAFAEISPVLLSHVINLSDGNGNTALHYSVSHSNFNIVRLLLDTGVCNVNHQNKAGYTALMLAALASVEQEADMAVVRRLFSMGNVNAKASQAGQTALMLAVSHGRQEMVEVLLACGADPNLQDEEGSTALMCACEHGRAGTVRLLLSQPACDVSIVDHDGNDAVSIALEAGHQDIAALISTHLTQSVVQTPD